MSKDGRGGSKAEEEELRSTSRVDTDLGVALQSYTMLASKDGFPQDSRKSNFSTYTSLARIVPPAFAEPATSQEFPIS